MVGVRTSELAAIFLATFENVRGTVISHQFPEDYVSWDQFKAISNVVLPRAELAFRLITVDAFQHYVIGCPQRIEGDHYQRNTLQFNVCLVIKPKPCSSLDDVTCWQFRCEHSVCGLRLPFQEAYEALVLKINRYFHTLEEECAFLSTHLNKDADDGGHVVISKCLESIFTQLHTDGTCILDLNDCGSLYLRFCPGRWNVPCNRVFLDSSDLVPDAHLCKSSLSHRLDNETEVIRSFSSIPWITAQAVRQAKSEVPDECVFVLIDPVYPHDSDRWNTSSVNWKTMDFVGDRILPYLDGYHRLPELAHLAGIDLTVARLYLLNLIRIGIVKALPAPTFLVPSSLLSSNTPLPITMPGWLGLPRLATLLTNRRLAEACLDAIHCYSPYGYKSKARCSLLDAFHIYTILCGSPNFSLPHLLSATPHLRFVEANCIDETVPSSSPDQPDSSTHVAPLVSLLHLVQFGEVNGLIHRLKCYPISDLTNCVDSSKRPGLSIVNSISPDSVSSRAPKSSLALSSTQTNAARVENAWTTSDDETWDRIRSSTLDGLHSMDAIGCKLTLETGLVSPPLSPFFATELLSNQLHGRSLFPSVESNVLGLISSPTHPGCQKPPSVATPTSVADGNGLSHATPSLLLRINRRLQTTGKVDTSWTSDHSFPVPASPPAHHRHSVTSLISTPTKVPHLYWLWR